MTIGELSEKMTLACSTITDLVDRMEKSGLVVRKRDDRDKRVVRVIVLPKGFDIVEKVLEKRVKFLEEKINSFSNEEKSMLNNVLERLYSSIEE